MKLYVCKSMKLYKFLRSKGIYPELRMKTLDKNPNLDGRPCSIFFETEELSNALLEWSSQYGGGSRA